ncbi:histone-like nucleoid-structuring protein Lsr2 [Microbacterium sp. Clip185]|uniref:histone-like nucleoid-structuring protein Lsr2 n=1 Tax=Microbacterium sp. Clip185 TaxID=3025663 RepID=UPI002365E4AA|nr:Lsr2 family protein [Microbacterium sp. Clip185]WDG17168.1 Lsr2 family protein [Microbacterium sp. Clip185]
MARRIVHQLVDDLDDSVLEVGEGETVLFSLDGIAYEIDLSDANAAALRDAMAPYVSAARRISGRSTASIKPRARATSSTRDLTAIREWAKANGHQVSERGRVAASVIDAYDAAH